MSDATGLAEALLRRDGFRALGMEVTSSEVRVTVESVTDCESRSIPDAVLIERT